jgi:hypothetical protein
MSRFFRPANDSSSESSSDEEELYSEEEEEDEKQASDEGSDEEEDEDSDDDSSEDEDGQKKKGASRFMRGAGSVSDDSSDDDRAKVVKSAKDKRLEELEATVKAIENGEKINDWGSISTGNSPFCFIRHLPLINLFLIQSSISSIDRSSSLSRLETRQNSISRLLQISRTS